MDGTGCSNEWQECMRGFEILPLELWVYIVSLLPTLREKLKLRYVSQRLRVVTDGTPSLWSEFVWPLYDCREELSLMSILKTCGQAVKRLIFPDNVTPSKLITMVSFCKNVTQISLPPKTKINPGELKRVLQHMEHLERLEVQIKDNIIEPLLVDRMKELTVYVTSSSDLVTLSFLKQWMDKEFVPLNLNVVCLCDLPFCSLKCKLISSWLQWRANPNTANPAPVMALFKLYDSFKIPLTISCKFPILQLYFSQLATLPFTKASGLGMHGLDCDLLQFTDCKLDDRVVHMAAIALRRVDHTTIGWCSDTNFVTEFDVGSFHDCYSGHLEQIALAFPNLQRLNLSGNKHCLENMNGIRKLAQCCKDLRGLNLLDIPYNNVHYSTEMFDALCDLKLTHLAIEMCVLKPSYHLMRGNGNEMCLLYTFSKFTSLQAIEYQQNVESCTACEYLMECEFIFLPEFTSLKYCNVLEEDPFTLFNILTRCEEVTCLRCEVPFLDLPSVCVCSLQQLCITSRECEITDVFVDAISRPGTLLHVVLDVNDINTTGITNLIENSHSLITLCIYVSLPLLCENGLAVDVKTFKSSLKEKFCGRKLFTCGKFKLQQEIQSSLDLYSILHETDLMPLWP